MKILFKILTVLTVIIALIINAAGFVRNSRDAEKMKEAEGYMAKISESQKELASQLAKTINKGNDIPSSSGFTTIAVLAIVLLVLVLGAGIYAFMKNPKVSLYLLGGIIILSLISYIMAPVIVDSGKYAPASNHKVALWQGIFSIGGAIFAYFSAYYSRKTTLNK